MPDLSAYAQFSVKFDFTGTPTLVLTDTSSYPAGVSTDTRVWFDITLPDCITRKGVSTSPDISGQAGPFSYTLRLGANQLWQNGTYTIVMYVEHPSYSLTTFTRTFLFNYNRVTTSLVQNFDVFTPNLSYSDTTNYTQPNYGITTNTVSWSATVGSVGTVTGNTSNFNLAYGGNYYDALYTITFQRNLLYTHSTYSWLTVSDKYSQTISTSADTPPPLSALIACITSLKAQLDAAVNNCKTYDTLQEKYEYAMVLYSHLVDKLQLSDTTNAYSYLQELLKVTTCVSSAINRDHVINPYVLPTGGGSGSTTVPNDVEFVVGIAAAMVPGQATGTFSSLVGYRIRFVRNQVPQSKVNNGGSYYNWDSTTGTITVVPAVADQELLQLQPY